MSVDRPCMDETQAVALLKRGDLTGLDWLVVRYQVKAVYAAYLIIHDRQMAEDVVQTAFLRAFEKIGQFDDHRPFGPWFLRSVVNAAIDTAEQQTRWLPLDAEAEEQPRLIEQLVSNPSYLEDLVEVNEVRATVRRALQQLAPEQRAVIVLRFFLEMSEAEITATMHRPHTTIKWWFRAARMRLKELLRPVWVSGLDKKSEELCDE